MSKPAGHQRNNMPLCTAFVDDMRSAFGAEEINDQIRRGTKGEPTFYAKENGVEIGTKAAEPVQAFSDTWLRVEQSPVPARKRR